MSKASPIQTNFTSGEISPRMYGRVDTSRYQNGARALSNFVVQTQGGIIRRSGSRYAGATKNRLKSSQLRKFEFADTQAYALEFGNSYMRILKDKQYVLDPNAAPVTAIIDNGGSIRITFTHTGGLPIAGSADNGAGLVRVQTSAVHNLSTGDIVFLWSPLDINAWGTWTITFVDSTHFDLQGSVATGTFGAGGFWTANNIIDSTVDNGAGLIRVTTRTPHNLNTGDEVSLPGFTPGPDPNSAGNWFVSVISATQFDLLGSVSTGTFNSDGVWRRMPRIGDEVEVSGNSGTMVLNGRWRVKSVQGIDRVTLANSTFTGTTGGTIVVKFRPLEIATPYAEADLPDLYVTQSADFMWITHRNYYPRRVMRRADDNWQIATPFFKDGPYLSMNSIAPQVNSFSPEDGSLFLDVVLELSAYSHTALVVSDLNFAGGDVNDYCEFRIGDQWYLGLITALDPVNAKIVSVSMPDNLIQHIDEAVKFRTKYNFNFTQPLVGSVKAAQPQIDTKIRNNPNAVSAAVRIATQFSGVFGQTDVGKYIRYPAGVAAVTNHWGQVEAIPSADMGAAVTLTGTDRPECTNFNTRINTMYNERRTATLKSFRRGAAFPMFRQTEDIGRLVRLGYSGRWTWGKITAWTSTSQVTVELYENIPLDPHNALKIASDGSTLSWRLGAWAERGANLDGPGFPSVSTLHEQRLWFGRTDVQSQTLWSSMSGLFENMDPTELDSTVTDASAITYNIVSEEVSPIQWLSSGAVLLVGGLGQEWQGRAASSIQEPITPTNISITPQTGYGSTKTARPYRIGSSTLFINRSGLKVRELSYNYDIDAFSARDITILSDHILKNGLKGKFTGYQKDPINIYWVLLGDGTLAGATYEKDQEVIAWHRHAVAGGFIESFTVVPTTEGNSDLIYMVVKRTVDALEQRYIEIIEEPFEPTTIADKEDMFFVDSGTTFDLTSRTVFEGMDYLEGEDVQVVADGEYVGDQEVMGGTITLAEAAEKVQVGLQYDSLLSTLNMEAGAVLGTSQVKTKRTNKVGARVLKSLSLKHSGDGTDYTEHTFNDQSDDFFTGDTKFALVQQHTFEGGFHIKQDRPEPLNIVLLAPELRTGEEQ